MLDATRLSTPVARSAPKDASSSPTAMSRPPRVETAPRVARSWNSVIAFSAIPGSTRRRRMISAVISSASSSENCFITWAARC